MNVSVIVNLHCNFRCRYCYEGNQKGSSFMSEETADQLISFIKKRFQPDMTRLTLDFYGGEPLLSVNLIRHIAGSLQHRVSGVLLPAPLLWRLPVHGSAEGKPHGRGGLLEGFF
jgi:sulfatase maturation enzyme AslB (radical SAM superfamily)